jgi:hypothetical protein
MQNKLAFYPSLPLSLASLLIPPPTQIYNKNHNKSIEIHKSLSPCLLLLRLTNVEKMNAQKPKTFWKEKINNVSFHMQFNQRCVFSYLKNLKHTNIYGLKP